MGANWFQCCAPPYISGATHLQKNFWSILIDSSATHLHLQIFSVLRTLQGIWPNGLASIMDPISGATHLFVASWCYGVNATLEPYPPLILEIILSTRQMIGHNLWILNLESWIQNTLFSAIFESWIWNFESGILESHIPKRILPKNNPPTKT